MGVEEILVHISASNSKKDDNRFRAMAEAYQEFACSNRVNVHPDGEGSGKVAEHVAGHDMDPQHLVPFVHTSDEADMGAGKQHGSLAETIRPAEHDACTFVDDTQLAAAAVESQLWPVTQSEAVLSPSPLAGQGRKRRRMSGLSSSAESSKQRKTTVGEASEHEASSRASAAASSSPIHYFSSNEGANGVDLVDDSNQGQEQPAVLGPAPEPEQCISSSVPVQDQQLPAIATSLTRVLSSEIKYGERTLDSSMPQPSPSEARPTSALPTKKTPGHPSPVSLTPSTTLTARITETLPPAQPPEPINTRAAAPSPNPPPESSDPFHSLSTSITSPPPPVALNPSPSHPTTLNTTTTPTSTDPTNSSIMPPTLSNLLHLPHLSTKYHPRFTSRPILPLERGYWRIDVTPWLAKPGGDKVVREFWTSLETFLGRGRAGWGVWVVREVAVVRGEEVGDEGRDEGLDERQDDATGTTNPTQPVQHNPQLGMNVIRIYTFGLTVPHLYLLMYVFSKSWIRNLHYTVHVDGGADNNGGGGVKGEAGSGDVENGDAENNIPKAQDIQNGVEWIDAEGWVVVRM